MSDIRLRQMLLNNILIGKKQTKTFIYSRINKLLLETALTLFQGTGKPEALKHDLKGYWSRRITEEHRLIYRAEDDFIKIIACKLHYS